jgi:hypothetical protein
MILKKVISSIIGLLLILNQSVLPSGAWASPEITSSEINIPRSFQLELPPELGTIESILTGSGPTVIHVQEAHGSYEVQRNIAAILRYLKKQYNTDLVLLEGNAFELQPELVRFFPEDMAKTRKIANELAQNGIVSGPELFFLEEPKAKARGIENLDAYNRNGQAFVDVLREREQSQSFLRDMELQIDRLTSPYLNKDLRNFLKRMDSFESGTIPLDQWIEELRGDARKYLHIDLTNPWFQMDWPMLLRISALKKFETQLNVEAFKEERTKFLEMLKSLQPPAASKDLYSSIAHLLLSPLTQNNLPDPETGLLFESMVTALPKDFAYDAYPNVNLFIGHLILQSELKSGRLMEELNRLSDRIAAKLVRDEKQKEIVLLLQEHRLLKKLFKLELTPADYERMMTKLEVAGDRPDFDCHSCFRLRPSILGKRLLNLNKDHRVRGVHFQHLHSLDLLFFKSLEFYRGAQQRDRWMLENIEKQLINGGVERGADHVLASARNVPCAVVITGGFHAGPFQDYFSRKGYNYALITPKMTDVKDTGKYVQSMLKSYQDSRTILPATHRMPELITNGDRLASHHVRMTWLMHQVSHVMTTNQISSARFRMTSWFQSIRSRFSGNAEKRRQIRPAENRNELFRMSPDILRLEIRDSLISLDDLVPGSQIEVRRGDITSLSPIIPKLVDRNPHQLVRMDAFIKQLTNMPDFPFPRDLAGEDILFVGPGPFAEVIIALVENYPNLRSLHIVEPDADNMIKLVQTLRQYETEHPLTPKIVIHQRVMHSFPADAEIDLMDRFAIVMDQNVFHSGVFKEPELIQTRMNCPRLLKEGGVHISQGIFRLTYPATNTNSMQPLAVELLGPTHSEILRLNGVYGKDMAANPIVKADYYRKGNWAPVRRGEMRLSKRWQWGGIIVGGLTLFAVGFYWGASDHEAQPSAVKVQEKPVPQSVVPKMLPKDQPKPLVKAAPKTVPKDWGTEPQAQRVPEAVAPRPIAKTSPATVHEKQAPAADEQETRGPTARGPVSKTLPAAEEGPVPAKPEMSANPSRVPDSESGIVASLTYNELKEKFKAATSSGNPRLVADFIRKYLAEQITNEGNLSGFVPHYTVHRSDVSDPELGAGKHFGQSPRSLQNLLLELAQKEREGWIVVRKDLPRQEMRTNTLSPWWYGLVRQPQFWAQGSLQGKFTNL